MLLPLFFVVKNSSCQIKEACNRTTTAAGCRETEERQDEKRKQEAGDIKADVYKRQVVDPL